MMHPLDWEHLYSITNLATLVEAQEHDFVPAEGLYNTLEGARRAGKKRYGNYAVLALKEPVEAGVGRFWEKFSTYLEDTHELYGNLFSYLAPRIFIDYIYVFDAQIRDLPPEAGIELFGEDREEAIRRTRRSRHFDREEMFLNTRPAWVYRLEPRYHGDLYTLTPRVPPQVLIMMAEDPEYSREEFEQYEDPIIPRIPVCRKLTKCHESAFQHYLRFVYMSIVPLITVMPSKNLVFDAPETGERWLIPPPEDHSFICVCEIKPIFGGDTKPGPLKVKKMLNPAYFAVLLDDQKSQGLDIELPPIL